MNNSSIKKYTQKIKINLIKVITTLNKDHFKILLEKQNKQFNLITCMA
jgi:hypothetical protein